MTDVTENTEETAVVETVTVARTGDAVKVNFEPGMTIEEALRSAGMSVSNGLTVRLNGDNNEDLETELQAGDTILLVGEVRGA